MAQLGHRLLPIAERFAIQNQFESMTGISLFAALVGLSIMLGKRQWLYGAASAGVGFLVLITATQTNIPGQQIEREAAILNTSILSSTTSRPCWSPTA